MHYEYPLDSVPICNGFSDLAHKMLDFIFRFTKEFGSITYKILFCSIDRSVLEYCSPLWSPHYHIFSILLESVQCKFIRFLWIKSG
ncbi:hypothetical protein J437_LFUL006785, partial [Ladona fulva]